MGCTLNFCFEHTWKDLFIDKYKDELLQLFTKIVKDDKDGATNAENMILQLLKKILKALQSQKLIICLHVVLPLMWMEVYTLVTNF